MGFAKDLIVALIVLGVIIVIHEFGHFIVAKFFKIRVDTFSVGFGPRIFGFKWGETDYRLSAVFLGGYVKMAGENPGDSVTGAPNEFLSKPKWQRFLVAAAGPAMNVILAVGLMTGLFMYGTDVAEYTEGDAVVGLVETGSAAEAAGIQPGDRIAAIDGKQGPNWEEVEARILTSAEKSVTVVLDRDGKFIETSLTPVRQGQYETGYAGIQPKIRVTNVIGNVQPGSPAEAAGLKPGDEIVGVNGVDLKTSGKGVSEIIQSLSEATFPLSVMREKETLEVTVTPRLQDGKRMIGVGFVFPMIHIKEGFTAALARSMDKNLEYGTLIFRVLGKLVTREASMKSVDGPIGIMRATSQFYDAGFAPLLMFMAMISLNLGLMNLLPIPILDGGVMLLLMVEGIMGQDLSLALKERIVQVSFVFLLTFFVFVIYNDVVKMLPASQPGP